MTHDSCFMIADSAKIYMERIKIHNTYSKEADYGYGFVLDNVWDSCFRYLEAHQAVKGVFSTFNTNCIQVSDSELNRIDVHCYGKDVTCVNCFFHNDTPNTNHIINRFSSLFGTLTYRNCRFDNFIPVRQDTYYDALTAFDVVMEDCTMNITTGRCKICDILRIYHERHMTRSELMERCLPNLKISNLRVNINEAVHYIDFYHIGVIEDSSDNCFGHMDEFSADINIFGVDTSHTLTIQGCNYNICSTGRFTSKLYISREPVSPLIRINGAL